MKSINIPPSSLNLRETLFSGQAFRWDETDGSFTPLEKVSDFNRKSSLVEANGGIMPQSAYIREQSSLTGFTGFIKNIPVRIERSQNALLFSDDRNILEAENIKEYFGLDTDLEDIVSEISVDEHITAAVKEFCGLRILNQQPWEVIGSFLLSSCNNIKRIRLIIDKLSYNCGIRKYLEGKRYYSFPSFKTVAKKKESDLRLLGMGFRAPFFLKAARRLDKDPRIIESVKRAGYAEAKSILESFEGIGGKIADCILLFGFGRYEAFPCDVWIKRLMERLYFNGKSLSEKKITEFAQKHFGRYAGYAQQYLYHYERTRS